jgi:hypothetical protein
MAMPPCRRPSTPPYQSLFRGGGGHARMSLGHLPPVAGHAPPAAAQPRRPAAAPSTRAPRRRYQQCPLVEGPDGRLGDRRRGFAFSGGRPRADTSCAYLLRAPGSVREAWLGAFPFPDPHSLPPRTARERAGISSHGHWRALPPRCGPGTGARPTLLLQRRRAQARPPGPRPGPGSLVLGGGPAHRVVCRAQSGGRGPRRHRPFAREESNGHARATDGPQPTPAAVRPPAGHPGRRAAVAGGCASPHDAHDATQRDREGPSPTTDQNQS